MIRKLRCWMGLHPWEYDEIEGVRYRECKYCHRVQVVRQCGDVSYWTTTRVGNTQNYTGKGRKTTRQMYILYGKHYALGRLNYYSWTKTRQRSKRIKGESI